MVRKLPSRVILGYSSHNNLTPWLHFTIIVGLYFLQLNPAQDEDFFTDSSLFSTKQYDLMINKMAKQI